MRVGIVGLLHESNTFLHAATTHAQFEQDLLAVGEQVREQLAAAHHEIGGFFQGLAEQGMEAVPLFAARALPFGVITAETFDWLLERMFEQLDRADPLDGLLVAPHGATVSAAQRDADGYWLAQLRARLGPQRPIIGTIDPHANLSPRMVAATNALIAYRTNPHVDQRQRGIEAAALMGRTLRGEIRPTQAACFPPLAINIERQQTADEPCRAWCQQADAIRRRPGVLSASLVLGFPYADVEELGSSAVVVTDNDPAQARVLADELTGWLWDHRQQFVGQLIGIDDALDRAAALPGPICLLDMGDNVGGGSSGDGTALASAIHRRRLPGAFVCLADPESVAQAEAAGCGQRIHLRVGGKTDPRHGEPIEAEFTVTFLGDGRFTEPEVRHGGFTTFDQGRTALVRTDAGLTVMLTSRRMVPFSLRQMTAFGLEPRDFHLIIAKGVHAPLAAYAPVCRHILRVHTPGATTADMTALDYHHRRRPMFPFEPETAWLRS